MKNEEHKKISKLISLVLRHNPSHIGIDLDPNGWASVRELIEGINKKGMTLTHDILDDVVSSNDKQRFCFNDDKSLIRANQGHSVKVDLELKQEEPPEFLYYGTVQKFMAQIQKQGLQKMSRQHVHLSRDIKTANIVATRRGKPIILTIKSGKMYQAGIRFYLSKNGVWLTDTVATKYIIYK